MNGIYNSPEDIEQVEKPFCQEESRGLLLKQGEFNSPAKPHEPVSIYPISRSLTRADFECEEDWITYSLNHWFGHLFIDPHLD